MVVHFAAGMAWGDELKAHGWFPPNVSKGLHVHVHVQPAVQMSGDCTVQTPAGRKQRP